MPLRERQEVQEVPRAGVSSDSTAELIARVLGWNGPDRIDRAIQVLAQVGGDLAALEHRLEGFEGFEGFEGGAGATRTARASGTAGAGSRRWAGSGRALTHREARRLASALALGRRAAAALPPERFRVHGPSDVVAFLGPRLQSLPYEEFYLLILNVRHEVVETRLISRGILDASLVHPREVFAPAIVARASAVLFAHNHPSGDPTPSAEDHRITKQLTAAGDLLGIRVLDHLVIGNPGWRSIRLDAEGDGPSVRSGHKGP